MRKRPWHLGSIFLLPDVDLESVKAEVHRLRSPARTGVQVPPPGPPLVQRSCASRTNPECPPPPSILALSPSYNYASLRCGLATPPFSLFFFNLIF